MNTKNVTILDIENIKKILPHRYPFLLVDRVIALDLEKGTITAVKCVTANEEFFKGHFPEDPIMPGVLILEALAQTAGILVHQKGFTKRTPILLNVNRAKFRHPALPGDVMYLYVHGTYLGSRGGRVFAKAVVDDQIATEAEIGFTFKKF